MYPLRPVSPSHWNYPTSGPAPLTPHVVLAAPVGGSRHPTPPVSPSRPHVAPTFDHDAPCPATPQAVPSGQPEVGTNQLSNGSSSSAEPSSGSSNGQDRNQHKNPRALINPCFSPNMYEWPSPVLIMVQRAYLDLQGRYTQPVSPLSSPQPITLFTFTGGIIPRTGNNDIDSQTLQYYAPRPCVSSLLGRNSHTYPISCIEAVQNSLRLDWSSVYPKPITPVVIRLRDLVGGYDLKQRANGYAFVVPAADSIWTVVCQRGIDLKYRPINPQLSEAHSSRADKTFYDPQHILASTYTVNIFLELGDSPTGQDPWCEYIGAYALQLLGNTTISPFDWARIDPRERQIIFERVPERFTVCRHPLAGQPCLPFVRFRYYQWDKYILGMADKSFFGMNLVPVPHAAERVQPAPPLDSVDNGSETGA